MEQRSCNIFEKYQRNAEANNINHFDEWQISDCEEDENIVAPDNLNIVNNSSSSDEEQSLADIGHTTAKRSKFQQQQYSKSARKKPLPHIAVKRKSIQEGTPKRRALSLLNSPEKRISTVTTSPWNKAQHAFAAVQKSASAAFAPKTTKTNEVLSWRCSQPTQDIDDTFIESSLSSTKSISSGSQNIEIIAESFPGTQIHPNSQTIETPTTTSQASTELDRLIALIEQKQDQPPQIKSQRKGKHGGCKNGYLHELRHTLKSSKTDRKYLEHDKKYGLQSGTKLRVLELEVSFGVHLAMVEVEEHNDGVGRHFGVVLDAEMAKKVEVGSELEAFFSAELTPYIVNGEGGSPLNIFVQPNKLLLL